MGKHGKPFHHPNIMGAESKPYVATLLRVAGDLVAFALQLGNALLELREGRADVGQLDDVGLACVQRDLDQRTGGCP